MIDIGINFTDRAFQLHSDFATDPVAECIAAATDVGVDYMIVTGTHLACSQAAMELVERFPETLFCTAGIHPHHAKDWDNQTLPGLRELLQHPQVVAVGETGLDFNRNFSPPEAQIAAFEAQLQLAAETGKALFLHERDAFEMQLQLLKKYRPQLGKGVVHCFTGNEAALMAYLELDFYIGITGWVCDERRGQALQKLVPLIPDERLLIETDGPYLLPRDLKPKPQSKRNEPKYLPHIADSIARLRHQSLAQLAKQTFNNSIDCFDLPLSKRPLSA